MGTVGESKRQALSLQVTFWHASVLERDSHESVQSVFAFEL